MQLQKWNGSDNFCLFLFPFISTGTTNDLDTCHMMHFNEFSREEDPSIQNYFICLNINFEISNLVFQKIKLQLDCRGAHERPWFRHSAVDSAVSTRFTD